MQANSKVVSTTVQGKLSQVKGRELKWREREKERKRERERKKERKRKASAW